MKFWIGLALAAWAFASAPAQANIGEVFGFGARSQALGGADIGGGFDGFAAYANPAALPFENDSGKRLLLSWGLIYVSPNFTPITNVVIQNAFTGDSVTTGNVGVSYLPTFGQSIGLTYRLFPEWANFTFGLTAFLPTEQVAYMDTGELYIPEYFLYRSRTQRPQVDAGFGASLGKGFQLGVGMHVGFSLTSNATIFLQTDTTKSSNMRFIASLVPRAAPYFGFFYHSGKPAPEIQNQTPDKLTLGAVLRLAVPSPNNMNLSASAKLLGPLVSFPFTFLADSVLFYDPMAIELGGTWSPIAKLRTFFQIDYEYWMQYQIPGIVISNPQITDCGGPCGVALSGTQSPAYGFHNILVPRFGTEFLVSDAITLRVGYSYHDSIVDTADPTNGNYIDPPRHSINLGAGWKFKHFLNFDVPCDVDLYMTYNVLASAQVTKTQADSAGDTSDQVIGAPGYSTGGNMVGGGASLSWRF